MKALAMCAVCLVALGSLSIGAPQAHAQNSYCSTNHVDDRTKTTANAVDKKTDAIAVSCERGKQYLVESKAVSSSCTPIFVTVTWLPGAEGADAQVLQQKQFDPKIVVKGLDASPRDIGSCPVGGDLAKAINGDTHTRAAVNEQHFDALVDQGKPDEAFTFQQKANAGLQSGITNAFAPETTNTEFKTAAQQKIDTAMGLNSIIEGSEGNTTVNSAGGQDMRGLVAIQGGGGVETLSSSGGDDALGADAIFGTEGTDSFYTGNPSHTFVADTLEPEKTFSWSDWVSDVPVRPNETDYFGRMGDHFSNLYEDSWVDNGVDWLFSPSDTAVPASPLEPDMSNDWIINNYMGQSIDATGVIETGPSTFAWEDPDIWELYAETPIQEQYSEIPLPEQNPYAIDPSVPPLPEQRVPDFPERRPDLGIIAPAPSAQPSVQYQSLSDYFRATGGWCDVNCRVQRYGTSCNISRANYSGTGSQNSALLTCIQSL